MRRNPGNDKPQPAVVPDYQAQAAAVQYLLDNSPASMLSVDRNYCYTAFNRNHAQAMQALYGANICLGNSLLDYITLPTDRETARRNLDRALAGAQFVDLTYLGNETHKKVFIRVRHTPIQDERGSVVGAQVYSEDVTELKKNEEQLLEHQTHLQELVQERTAQLQASEALYRGLFENMSSIVMIVDPQTSSILDANQAASEFYGIPHALLTSLKISDLTKSLPDTIPGTLSKFASGQVSQLNTVHYLPNGDIRDVEVFSGLLEFKGRPALLGVIHDVTDRKKAEKALQESEAKFKTLFHNLPLPGAIYRFVYDQTGKIVDWNIEDANDFVAAAFKIPVQELIGKSVVEIYGQEVIEPYLAISREVKASGSFRMFESFFSPYEREYLSTSFMIAPDLYVVINLDISEQKQAEALLSESEERYRFLVETNLDAVMLTSPDGSIQAVNQAAVHMFGWTETEFKHLTREHIVDTNDPRLLPALEERARSGHYTGGLTFIRKDGSKFPAEISSNLFIDRNGITRAGVFIQDISERVHDQTLIGEALAFNQKIIEAAPVGIMIYKATGQCVAANAAAAKIGESSPEYLLKLNFRNQNNWKHSGLYENALTALETGQPVTSLTPYTSTLGKEMMLSGTMVSFKSGGELHLMYMFVDHSAQQKVIAALRAAQAELEQRNLT